MVKHTTIRIAAVVVTTILFLDHVQGFTTGPIRSGSLLHSDFGSPIPRFPSGTKISLRRYLSRQSADDREEETSSTSSPREKYMSRRDACRVVVGGTTVLVTGLAINTHPAVAAAASVTDTGYVPAVRPTAYRVDSTQPPTLIPLSDAPKQIRMLQDLGRGSGTDKGAILEDRINLNNVLNKVVFGTIDKVSTLVGPRKADNKSGPGYASFVCLGVPAVTMPTDVDLALNLLSPIVQARNNNKKSNTALGLSFCPLSVQPALDSYSKTGDEAALKEAMQQSGVDDKQVDLYLPLFRYAQQRSLQLLALLPEIKDIRDARTQGLQTVNIERRQTYVADPQGFIALTQEPKYKVYTDRSLLKDFTPLDKNDKVTGFFAERILVHEAAATAAARYAVDRPESLVVIVAPIPDLRYLQGINGRIPRVAAALSGGLSTNKITDDAVTTILLNPTAAETLSKSRYLRLEIGTGPETLEYQSKVADYFWFSTSPKVNMIPRLMNG